jgi:hypothetical protein
LRNYGTSNARSLDEPVPTITAQSNHLYLCQPQIHQVKEELCLEEDIEQLTIRLSDEDECGGVGLEPFIVNYNGTGIAH